MRRPLVAIKSCERDCLNGFNQLIRDTWLSSFSQWCVPVFFVGWTVRQLRFDEVRLNCPDDYMSLPHKTKAILTWAYANKFEHVFLCDTDSYVRLDKLESSGYCAWDMLGCFNGPLGVPHAVEGHYAWVSGGNGYWLSRAALYEILKKDQNHWAEDLWVSQVVQENGGLRVGHDSRFGNGEYSSHFCSEGMKRKFEPEWMLAEHAKYGGVK